MRHFLEVLVLLPKGDSNSDRLGRTGDSAVRLIVASSKCQNAVPSFSVPSSSQLDCRFAAQKKTLNRSTVVGSVGEIKLGFPVNPQIAVRSRSRRRRPSASTGSRESARFCAAGGRPILFVVRSSLPGRRCRNVRRGVSTVEGGNFLSFAKKNFRRARLGQSLGDRFFLEFERLSNYNLESACGIVRISLCSVLLVR
jgi:hypothetical protein